MVVLITGCRSGFGLLAAVSAARAGHKVYAGLRDVDTAERLRDAARGLDVTPVQLDVTAAEQRESVVADIVERHGAVDALVNNAGIAIAGPLEELTEPEMRKLFEVNVFGLWALTNRVLPGMRAKRDGVIVNVSSMAGRMALPTLGAYAATKHAVLGMSEALRHELADHGVRVVLVEPGPYKTDILGRNRNIGSEVARQDGPYASLIARLERMEAKVVPKAGDPQQVADRIIALLGDPNPVFRHPMGPTTEARRLARWLLPHRAFEGLIRTVIRRA
jgi:NAD(P)-dependent dehydrogenase (short-subunit alcohol dehydrogenase family)